MKRRGTPKGTKQNPWSDADKAIIEADLRRYPPEDYVGGKCDENGLTRTGRLTLLLPGRTPVQIQNSISLVRVKARGICFRCRKPLSDEDRARSVQNCSACKALDRAKRARWKAEGRCGQCGVPMTPVFGASATRCHQCIARHRPSRKKAYKEMNAKKRFVAEGAKKPAGAANALGWLCSRSSSAVPVLIKERQARGALPDVVDLFGGSGSFSIQCREHGLDVLAYNDLHPMLACYIRQVVREPFEDFRKAVREITTWWPVERGIEVYRAILLEGDSGHSQAEIAALLYLVSRSVPSRRITRLEEITVWKPAATRALRAGFIRLRRALEGSQITQLDWREAIDRFDDPTTCFVVDPPWAGCTQPYDFKISSLEHAELFRRLMAIEGSFIATLGSSREALQHLHNAGVPYFYWRSTFGGLREILASDQILPSELFSSMRRIDPASLGLKRVEVRVD